MQWIKSATDYGVIGLMVVLSIIAFAIAIERYLTIRHVKPLEFSDKREFEIFITSRLHIIATIGSNAPYIGLLGTVLGIMLTFYTMGQDGVMDTKKVMTGLALALKATASGLLVAIPAIVFYNLLLRKIKVLLLRWEIEHGKQSV